MTEYIILSPTLSRAFYHFDNAVRILALYYPIKAWRRRQHVIEVGDVSLNFMTEELFERKGHLGCNEKVLWDDQFEIQLTEFLAREFSGVHIGDEVEFDVFKDARPAGFKNCGELIVTGKVVYIHEENKWFSVEYGLEETLQRTSFKFDDLGRCVRIVRKKERKNG